MIIDYVRRKHANLIVPVYSSFIDVYYFIADNIKKNIPLNEIRNLFYTKLHTLFRICKGKCKDQDRMNASLQSIENNINLLKTEVTGVPIQFVFNIDEIGSTDFADAEDMSLIAPIDYHAQTAPYPACRSIKRSSCIACI